ncbi:MAG: DM13 domain-containing protein [Gemmatimonadales bacterium]|nr:DM13 domain-containing protein [Gemmatimonadales bacterium]
MHATRPLHTCLRIAVVGALASAALAVAPAAAQSSGTDAMEKDAMRKDAMGKAAIAPGKGTLQGAEGHEAAGAFEIHGAGAERHVRLGSDFKVERGPDVHVVLSRGPKVSDGDLYLGQVKRFSGASDYAVPANADLASYTHLVLWCKKYSVAMARAPLPQSAMAGDAMGKDAMAKDDMKEEDGMQAGAMMEGDKMTHPDSAAVTP